VILSVYKKDKLQYVQDALESLYSQTLKADIFIKIDGPIDKRLEEYLLQEHRKGNIAYLSKRKENRGLATSLNELIKEALKKKYEYIFRMDADDICGPDRFLKQIEFMDKNRDIDICGTYIEEFGDDVAYKKLVKYPLTHETMFEFFKKRVPLAHVSACFRKSFFEKAGLYPESGHISNEDTLMWLKGFENGCRFANIDYVGVKVRVSRDFFGRRAGVRKVLCDFKNRLEVIRRLHYGFDAYFYAFGIMGINLLPTQLKKLAYKYLR